MNKFTVPLALCLTAMAVFAVAAPSTGKVTLGLQKTLQTKDRVNILVSVREGTTPTLNQLALQRFSNRGDQATAVYNALNAQAAESQRSVLEMLTSARFLTTKVQSFWITNQVYVQGADQSTVNALAAMDEVSKIDEDGKVYLEDSVTAEETVGTLAEWGINKIQAQEAWEIVGNGNGAVVGVIDTGARYTHEAIRDSYRGGQYSWYDPVGRTQNPGDGNGHGTHCTGTVAGTNGIGVAPGAKWISCKGLQDDGFGSFSDIIACAQFMACPHTYNGQAPNCSLAPHVVSNSYGGGAGSTVMDDVIRVWHAANIIPVFANGNNGLQGCQRSDSPGDSQAGVIAVGSTTSADTIAERSSRGPSFFGTLKPDISAPGQDIRSAWYLSDTSYNSISGTSMACPHVAGLVALLKSVNPNANFTTIKTILESTADRSLSFSGETCSGVPDNQFPNYQFGHGRINAVKAVQAI